MSPLPTRREASLLLLISPPAGVPVAGRVLARAIAVRTRRVSERDHTVPDLLERRPPALGLEGLQLLRVELERGQHLVRLDHGRGHGAYPRWGALSFERQSTYHSRRIASII